MHQELHCAVHLLFLFYCVLLVSVMSFLHSQHDLEPWNLWSPGVKVQAVLLLHTFKFSVVIVRVHRPTGWRRDDSIHLLLLLTDELRGPSGHFLTQNIFNLIEIYENYSKYFVALINSWEHSVEVYRGLFYIHKFAVPTLSIRSVNTLTHTHLWGLLWTTCIPHPCIQP